MNRLMILVFGSLFIWSCSSNKPLVRIEGEEQKSDSTEYELVVSEPGFESWFVTHRKPVWFHEESYYKQFNQLYTNEWNNRVRGIENDYPFNELIDYNKINQYGIELEHKLYWYYKFMMDKYDFKLLVTDHR
jgi:hypothetical protein